MGSQIAVEFWAYLRDEERFDTPEELSAAIGEDVRRPATSFGDVSRLGSRRDRGARR